MKSRQQGFTLVELIVVIVILGILAATALPKFIDVASDARGGVMKGVQASMQGAGVMIYGKSAAKGQQSQPSTATTPPSVIPVAGGTALLTEFGYPKAGTDWSKLIDLNPEGDFVLTTANVIQHKSATDPTKCSVTYVAPTVAGEQPKYTLDESGC